MMSSAVERRLARYAAAVEAVERGEGPAWLPEAVEMLQAGHTGLDIAEAVGVNVTYVYALLKDPTGDSERERKARYGGRCIDCGTRTSYRLGGVNERCGECFQTRNAERNERIIAAWNEGEPVWYIAEREGLTGGQVQGAVQHARRQGEHVELHRKRNRSDWPEIERLHRSGATYAEIAAAIGDSAAGVAAKAEAMRRAGIDLPPRGIRYSVEDVADLEDAWARGESTAEIARRLGITTAATTNLISRLRAEGYDFPRRRGGRKKAPVG